MRFTTACLLMLAASPMIRAAEVTSNGNGGGPWSDPATWRTKAVPGPVDEVVIAKDDIVTFDRDDDGKITCKQLFLDPRGRLAFKPGGKRVMCVDGVVESHGTIKLDATGSADDLMVLKLVADKDADRELRLKKGGNITLMGKPNLPDGKRNVIVSSSPPKRKEGAPFPLQGNFINKEPGCSYEMQHAYFENWNIYITGLDNTGSKPNERLNINGCRFNGQAYITYNGCDTAVISNCTFDDTDPNISVPRYGIFIYACSLCECKNNVIRGRYAGINGTANTECVVSGCTIEKCPQGGMYWYGTNAMLRDLTIRDCSYGITTTSMSGSLENITIEKCKVGYNHAGATVQANNLVIKDVPKDGVAIDYVSGPLILLNSPIKPEEVKMNLPVLQAAKPDYVPVEWMYFLIAGVKGIVPADCTADVKTVGLAVAAGAEDPNVRNVPAPLVGGRSPMPKTLQSIIVKGAKLDVNGKASPPPSYTVGIYAPPAKEGEAPKLLKSGTVTPGIEWHRPKADAPTLTVEIEVP